MIVNGSTLKVYSDILSKVDAPVVHYTGFNFMLENESAVVVIEDVFIKQQVSFSVSKKLIADVFLLLGRDSTDYEVIIADGVLQFKEAENVDINISLEPFTNESEIYKETKNIDIDIQKVIQVGKFADGRLKDIFKYVYLLDDGIYAGSVSFFVRMFDKINFEGFKEGVGIDPKAIEVLENNILSISLANDNSFLLLKGQIDILTVDVLCKAVSLDEEKIEMFKEIFTVINAQAVIELDNISMREVAMKLLDPLRDELVLHRKEHKIICKFVKDTIIWNNILGRVISGNWKQVKLLGIDFIKLLENFERVSHCGNKFYAKNDLGLECVCSIL